jgi:hypothetical protein
MRNSKVSDNLVLSKNKEIKRKLLLRKLRKIIRVVCFPIFLRVYSKKLMKIRRIYYN